MATTITSAFASLKENLEITGLQKSTVSTRQQNVRAAVEDGMTVLDSFLVGSYSRHTMIAPLGDADIDIFVILDPSYHSIDGQASLLEKVRQVLLKTYPKTPKISKNGQAVTITFTDFMVDVVPAFYRKGGGYLIPDSSQRAWISTNPNTHDELMNAENAKHGEDLVPMVKMIKVWNRVINRAFVSFYLELLAIKIFTNVTISDYPSGMRYFLDKGREAIKYKVRDPVDYGGEINGLDGVSTVDEAISRFDTACTRARRAEDYAANGKISNAIDEWRKTFGGYFPAYG